MKHLLFFLLMALSVTLNAQEIETGSMNIDAVFEACATMQESLEKNDTSALVAASAKLKEAKATAFSSLYCKDDSISSLEGHFVFYEAFVDSLVAGKDAYSKADHINRLATHRGQTSDGSIRTKTCFVKAGKSTRYTFASLGRQELGIITEPEGRVYVRVHVTNKNGYDARYNDDKNAVNGTRRYRRVFDLPKKQRNIVALEVINRGNKDTSFVVISN